MSQARKFLVGQRPTSGLLAQDNLEGEPSGDTSRHRLMVREKLDEGPGLVPLRRFVDLQETWAHRNNHSDRSACMTSTRAARAAGSIDATTAAPRSTNAETTTGNAPGIFKSPK